MKGLWSKDKGDLRGYKPALDALKAIDREILTSALLAVVENGCALMIGATRDHGAVSLILMDGNERHKLYPANVQELQQAFEDLIASLGGDPESVKPSGRKTR
jgi:hypothetical protein